MLFNHLGEDIKYKLKDPINDIVSQFMITDTKLNIIIAQMKDITININNNDVKEFITEQDTLRCIIIKILITDYNESLKKRPLYNLLLFDGLRLNYNNLSKKHSNTIDNLIQKRICKLEKEKDICFNIRYPMVGLIINTRKITNNVLITKLQLIKKLITGYQQTNIKCNKWIRFLQKSKKKDSTLTFKEISQLWKDHKLKNN